VVCDDAWSRRDDVCHFAFLDFILLSCFSCLLSCFIASVFASTVYVNLGKIVFFFLSAVEFGCVMVVVFITTSFLYFIRSRTGS